MTKFSNNNLQVRPPVVVIMGHVDHGKTSLLDYIRKSKVAAGEAGGITQHIGAYQVEHNGKQITFLDTPGHEAFYAMRSRGAKVADIAVLVVAADDGIMPQTKEAIEHIKHAGIPMVIVISKIDKPNIDAMKVKNQLLAEGIVIEEFKGKTPCVEVSNKTGKGIDSFLEIISLVAEIEELKVDVAKPASGVVIEAQLNHRHGPTATLLIKEGTLYKNDIISFSSTFGKARELKNFLGKDMEQALPGSPALVVGMGQVPMVGEKFEVVDSIEAAGKIVEEKQRKYETEREVIEPKEGSKILNIVLKADVGGTLEAVHEVLRGIKSETVSLRVLSEGSGEIMESDVKLASAAGAIIIGFRTKVNKSAELFVRQMKIEIILSDIIYELVERVRTKINELSSVGGVVEEFSLGEFRVIAIFRTEKSRMIVGGKVLDGEIKRGSRIRVVRGGEVLGEGKVAQLKIRDKTVDNAKKHEECGVLFDGSLRIEVGDILKVYELRQKI